MIFHPKSDNQLVQTFGPLDVLKKHLQQSIRFSLAAKCEKAIDVEGIIYHFLGQSQIMVLELGFVLRNPLENFFSDLPISVEKQSGSEHKSVVVPEGLLKR